MHQKSIRDCPSRPPQSRGQQWWEWEYQRREAKAITTTRLYPTLSRLASDGAMSATTENLEDLVRASVRAEIDDLRRFLDRRIAELSMEIHATVQLVDYSETNLSAKLASIHEQIARVVAPPAAATYNSGVELEAVVQATENAANQIMEAAEAIGSWLQAGGDPAALPAVTQQVNAIFEACTFQDLPASGFAARSNACSRSRPCCQA